MEALDLELLRVVGLDEVRVGEALLGDRADGAAAPPLLARRLLDQAREPPRAEEEEREDGERHEGELPAEIEERAGEEDDAKHVGNGVGHPREHEALDRGDIAGQARDQVSEPATLEEVERQALEMPEHAGSKREDEALADPRRPVVVDEPDEPAQQAQARERERYPEERPEVPGHQHLVDEHLEQPDLERLDRRQRGHADQQDEQPATVRTGVGPEPAEDLAHGDDRRGSDEPFAGRHRREQAGEFLPERHATEGRGFRACARSPCGLPDPTTSRCLSSSRSPARWSSCRCCCCCCGPTCSTRRRLDA